MPVKLWAIAAGKIDKLANRFCPARSVEGIDEPYVRLTKLTKNLDI